MVTFIARRLILSIPVLVLASVVVFFGVSSIGDPLGELKRRPNVSQDTIEAITKAKRLDQPVTTQYAAWLNDALTKNFGTTLYDRPIWPDMRRALGDRKSTRLNSSHA